MTQVSLSTSTNFDAEQNVLVESQGTALTVRFDLDEPAPVGGLKVFVDSDVEQIINRLDLPGFAFNPVVENIDFSTFTTNFDNSGFALTIDQGATFGTFTINVFDNPEPDTFLPTTFDGLVEAVLSLKTQDQVDEVDQGDITGLSDYTTNPNSTSSTVIFADDVSQLIDAPEPPTDVPVSVLAETESNDTLATATATGLTADNSIVTISGEISGNFFDEDLSLRTDQTEDVDLYSVELAAGDVLRIDADTQQFEDSELDMVLQLFDAEGNLIIQSDDNFAPEELFNAGGGFDSYIEFTAESAGTYYAGLSSFGNGEFDFFTTDTGFTNRPYDPNLAGSGTGASSGEYTIDFSLNQSPTVPPTEILPEDGTGPIVSLTATPATYAGDFGNSALVANALLQFVETPSDNEDAVAASVLTLEFTVDGEIPEEGLEVFLNSNSDLTERFITDTRLFSRGVDVLGAVYDDAGAPTGLRLRLVESAASINLTLDSPENAPTDGVETVEFTLLPAAGYQANRQSISTSIYDVLADVPDVPAVPTVSLTASETALIESVGNTTTLTFSLSEPPPAAGVLVYVDSPVEGALPEFNVFDAEVEGATLPLPNGDVSGFYLRITEQTATITVSAFDETTNPQIDEADALEGIQELTFSIQAGAGYTVSAENAVTLTIADNPDSVVLPDSGDGEGPVLPGENELNDTIATAVDTGLSMDAPIFRADATLRVRDIALEGLEGSSQNDLTDISEDVDMYAFDLEVGQTLTLEVDTSGMDSADVDSSTLDSILRVFDAAGNEVAISGNNAVPDGVFQPNGKTSLEFTAFESGTYYAGISVLGNYFYDPNVQGSGSGWIFEGFEPGEYRLTASLDDSVLLPPMGPVTEGTEAADTLVGNAIDNIIDGKAGDDTVAGEVGDDIIMGGAGNDVLRGDANSRDPQDDGMGGNDIIFGGEGNDRIGGKSGNDILSGDAGDDFIWGDDGDDIIMGVTGNDTLVGDNFSDGSGSDLFVFGNGDGTDTILDFEVGIDRIGLVGGELLFADLILTQDGDNTLLGVASTSETLAILNNVQASALSDSSFEVVADVSNPEEAMALI